MCVCGIMAQTNRICFRIIIERGKKKRDRMQLLIKEERGFIAQVGGCIVALLVVVVL